MKELLATEPGQSAVCTTSFAANDPIFTGHFPGNPLVPGVILTEALAQTAGIAAASGYAEKQAPLFLLSAIRSMKFLRTVGPDELVSLHAKKIAANGDLMQFAVKATVNGVTVAEGQLVLSVAHHE